MTMHFQIASLAIHLIITLLWLVPKKIKNYETRFFGVVLIAQTFEVVSGILFSIFNLQFFEIRNTTIQLLAKFNNACIIVSLFFIYMYIYSKLVNEKRHKFLLFPLAAIPLFEILIILIVDIKVTPGEDLAGMGFGALFLFGLALLNVLLIDSLLIIYRKKFSAWLTFVVIMVSITILIGIASQYYTNLNSPLQLSSIISVAICFVALENPLNKIDIVYDCFKSSYIIPCMNRYFLNDIHGFGVYLAMETDFIDTNADEELYKMRKYIINELSTVPELEVFTTSERDLFVLCDNASLFNDFKDDLEEVIVEAKKELVTTYNIKTALIYIPDLLITDKAETLFRHVSIEKVDAMDSYAEHISLFIDKEKIEVIENEEKVRETIVNALNDDRIEVFYQPVYSSKEKKFTSAEALARIKKEDGSILLPKYFIKVAENTGLIMQIGDRVFEKVCIMLTDPVTSDLELDSIDINLSLIQCENLNLADNFIKIAEKYQINPSIINLEITEAKFVTVYENLSKNLEKLRNYGFRISLDDFGTGESNLNYLIKMDISGIKIDRHIIWDYFESNKIRNTINYIIDLCHKLNLTVTATGVEKIAHLEEMGKRGVDFIQGYYFFKPMPLSEYLQFLRPNAFEMDDTKKKMLKNSLQKRTIKRLDS